MRPRSQFGYGVPNSCKNTSPKPVFFISPTRRSFVVRIPSMNSRKFCSNTSSRNVSICLVFSFFRCGSRFCRLNLKMRIAQDLIGKALGAHGSPLQEISREDLKMKAVHQNYLVLSREGLTKPSFFVILPLRLNQNTRRCSMSKLAEDVRLIHDRELIATLDLHNPQFERRSFVLRMRGSKEQELTLRLQVLVPSSMYLVLEDGYGLKSGQVLIRNLEMMRRLGCAGAPYDKQML